MQLFEKSTWFLQYTAMMEEVKRHKWIESQKAGRDVGLEWAIVDWDVKHRVTWVKQWQAQAQAQAGQSKPDHSQ